MESGGVVHEITMKVDPIHRAHKSTERSDIHFLVAFEILINSGSVRCALSTYQYQW